jgi:predicted outer membrane repeat protein
LLNKLSFDSSTTFRGEVGNINVANYTAKSGGAIEAQLVQQ